MKSRFNNILTKSFLNKEYNTNKKSSIKLSEELNISSSVILRALHKYNFKVVYKRITKKQIKYFCKLCNKRITEQSKTGMCLSCVQKKERHSVSCAFCHKTIMVTTCKFNKNKYFFCDKKCRDKGKLIYTKRGKDHPCFIHGEGYAPYPIEFNDAFKNQIRKRDNYICQNCGMTEEEQLIVYGRNLDIHHIDYDKINCKEDNLITLCQGCNIRANFNRNYWLLFYQKKECKL